MSYGRDHLPALTEVSGGGVVKFQYLARELPNSPRDFTVLYLGSSSIPLDARVLVRIARMRGAALVWNQNGVAYPAWAGAAYERMNRPAARLLHAADHVFFQSAFCKLTSDRFLGVRVGPWEILYNPVDTRLFTPAPRPERPLTLLLGGSQYQSYRYETALRTLAELPDARLLVAGQLSFGKDANEAAHSLADRLGVAGRVEFTGAYTQADGPTLLRRADILLHTKVQDPCPTAVLEAMACGLPVVYAASGGTPELVGPDAGLGVESEVSWETERAPDPAALAGAVLKVADRLEEHAEAARARAVDRFDIVPWVERHRTVFADLLAARS